ncbi:unnamed protein product [Linum trigynum]|uniref:Uncharacterized protein n=1 Tax=Linum trigynum TaxID=586398 RepID=A0AAV2G7J2_9ROSI
MQVAGRGRVAVGEGDPAAEEADCNPTAERVEFGRRLKERSCATAMLVLPLRRRFLMAALLRGCCCYRRGEKEKKEVRFGYRRSRQLGCARRRRSPPR